MKLRPALLALTLLLGAAPVHAQMPLTFNFSELEITHSGGTANLAGGYRAIRDFEEVHNGGRGGYMGKWYTSEASDWTAEGGGTLIGDQVNMFIGTNGAGQTMIQIFGNPDWSTELWGDSEWNMVHADDNHFGVEPGYPTGPVNASLFVNGIGTNGLPVGGAPVPTNGPTPTPWPTYTAPEPLYRNVILRDGFFIPVDDVQDP